MRRAFSGLLVVVSLWVPAARAKDRKEQKEPLFMAQGFQFSQIDTICVAPTIDLRPDTTQPLYLGRSSDFVLADLFKKLGYKTVHCNPVNVVLDDLTTPSDAWMRKLDFGESRWLFILAVEYTSTPYGRFGMSMSACHAVVSGYLFDKQAAGIKLVWRDKVVGSDNDPTEWGPDPIFINKAQSKALQSERAVAFGAKLILAKFETRKGRIGFLGELTRTETFDVTCQVLWTALNDTLKNSGYYDIIQIDTSDMMAIYAIGEKFGHRMDDTILRPKDNGCSMQITIPPREWALTQNDAKSLSQRVHAVLSK